jgi:hypothetical protein
MTRVVHSGLFIPDPGSRSATLNLQLKKIELYFFEPKLQFTYPLKDVQATEEAFNPQKRKSSTSKHEIS